MVTDAQSFILPWPPSVNSLRTVTRTGRIISSPRYRDWQEDALAHLVYQGIASVTGEVEIEIEFGAPTKRDFDIDNHAKPILDLLVTQGIIEDDNAKILKRLTLIARDSGLTGAMVTIYPMLSIYRITLGGEE